MKTLKPFLAKLVVYAAIAGGFTFMPSVVNASPFDDRCPAPSVVIAAQWKDTEGNCVSTCDFNQFNCPCLTCGAP